MSYSSASSSPSPSQQFHHLQILGNHPVSPPAAYSFLDSHQVSGNVLFADCGPVASTASAGASMMIIDSSVSASLDASSPSAEDCQASSEYMCSQNEHHQQQSHIKSEFSNDQFAAIAHSYMSTMARSFSESSLSETCNNSSPGVTVAVKSEMYDSPSMYAHQGSMYDDYYANNENLYSTPMSQQQQQQHSTYQQQYQQQQQQLQNHNHNHSYSTSSLSTLSDGSPCSNSSSMSPRSPFSLTRTASEPAMTPLSQQQAVTAMPTSSSMGDLAINHLNLNMSMNMNMNMNGMPDTMLINMVKSTPKRSRGRRVSTSQPDNVSGGKLFTCHYDDCGKIFKRSEHLKRHVRSIHTQEKPFGCPIHNCTKRFSRSDNLNQHIRIHRHTGINTSGHGSSSSISSSSSRTVHEKNNRAFAPFTPFLHGYSGDLIAM
ncbi:hypothetical protein BGX28_000682 [Mortierella sp. GBA30]|nr:hypothetical protein BGX28_000682 [Mortierella sp. GBA30]